MTEICATKNSCARTAEQAPACGTVRGHLPNLPLARQLCTFALDGQISLEYGNTDDWSVPRRYIRQAWAHIERATTLSKDNPAAEDFFSDATILTNRAVETSKSELEAKDSQGTTERCIDARTLEIYLPAFKALQATQTLSTSEKTEQRTGLADLMDKIEESSLYPATKQGMLIKTAAHLLLSRRAIHPITKAEIPYYPASAREGRTREKSFTAHNHDGYYILRGTKAPIKIRGFAGRGAEYSKDVLFLPYNLLTTDSYKKVPDAPVPTEGIVSLSFDALAREARGEEVLQNEVAWLNLMSETIYLHVLNFRRNGNHNPYGNRKS